MIPRSSESLLRVGWTRSLLNMGMVISIKMLLSPLYCDIYRVRYADSLRLEAGRTCSQLVRCADIGWISDSYDRLSSVVDVEDVEQLVGALRWLASKVVQSIASIV